MSDVVELFPKDADFHHTLIEAGTISGPPDHPNLGQVRYFVSVVDADGGTMNVWDGAPHKDAVYEARAWELPIVDSVTTASSGGTA